MERALPAVIATTVPCGAVSVATIATTIASAITTGVATGVATAVATHAATGLATSGLATLTVAIAAAVDVSQVDAIGRRGLRLPHLSLDLRVENWLGGEATQAADLRACEVGELECVLIARHVLPSRREQLLGQWHLKGRGSAR